MVALSKRIHYGNNEIQDHRYHKFFEYRRKDVALLLRVPGSRLLVQFELLALKERLERHLELVPHQRDVSEPVQGCGDEGLVERYDHKEFLDVHFDDGLPDKRCAEKRPKRHQKVTACNAGQVEKWIWYLQNQRHWKDINKP